MVDTMADGSLVESYLELLDQAFDCDYDLHNGTVLINPDKLLISGKRWASISLSPHDNRRVVLLQNYVASTINSACLLSPILYHNLLGNKITSGDSVGLIQVSNCAISFLFPLVLILFNSISQVKNAQEPPIADEIFLSAIENPLYTTRSDALIVYDSIVKDYFRISRLVKCGDVLAISSRLNCNYYSSIDESSTLDWPCIYFRIQRLPNTSDVFQTTPNTQIYVHGSVKCSIPIKAAFYFSQKNFFPFLQTYLDPLLNCILPYFDQLISKIGTVLLISPAGCGKKLTCSEIAGKLGVNFYLIDCHSLLTDSPLTTAKSMKNEILKAATYGPCIVLLNSIHLLCLERDDKYIAECLDSCLQELEKIRDSNHGIVIIGSATCEVKELSSLFFHQVTLDTSDHKYRAQLIDSLLERTNIDEKMVAQINQSAQGLSLNQLIWVLSPPIKYENSISNEFEVNTVFDRLKKINHACRQAVTKVPNVQWSDIGGLEQAKKEILDCIERPLTYKQFSNLNFRRCGFLLYGPPGTGKTLLAKAVASNFSSNFLSVKGPELISAYVGQSEENIRQVFKKAIEMRPTIVFFDELDSLTPRRGNYGDSGGVMDRIVSQMACEMDLISNYSDIYIFGATNRPDLIDSALLRPGRFERWIKVGLPETAEERVNVLKALTSKFQLEHGLDLIMIEKSLPQNLSGADIYSIVSSAMLSALQRCINEIEHGKIDEKSANIFVTLSDFNL